MTRNFAPNKGQGDGIRHILAALASATDECILWPMSLNPVNGYGHFGYNGGHFTAHVYICEQVHGPRPGILEAAHSCHVRACINPRHISWQTHSDNMLGKRENGTSHANIKTWDRRGKLKREEVIQIRALEGQETQATTAARFNITESNVRHIRTRKTWKNVA